MTARTAIASTVHEPHGKPGGPGAFGIKGAQFPAYVQHVAGELIKQGKTKSRAYRMAIGIVRNWAHGHDGRGNNVSAQVQAAAVKAIAEYDALRARAKAIPNKGGRVNLASPALGDRSGMIALEVPHGVLSPVRGGLDSHHVTLAFLGQEVSDDALAKAQRAAETVARRHGPLAGTLGGVGAFPPGPDGVPVWATVDVPGLAELRQAIVGALGGHASEHGFTPHVTLTYVTAGQPIPGPLSPRPVRFGSVSVHRGDEVARYPLTGVGTTDMAPLDNAAVDLAKGEGGKKRNGKWNASRHPRAKAGSPQGGQFVPLSKGSGYRSASKDGKRHHVTRVKALQKLLNGLGVNDKDGHKLDVDGYYGPLTTSAVRRFQRRHDMKVTGRFGEATRSALRKATRHQGKGDGKPGGREKVRAAKTGEGPARKQKTGRHGSLGDGEKPVAAKLRKRNPHLSDHQVGILADAAARRRRAKRQATDMAQARYALVDLTPKSETAAGRRHLARQGKAISDGSFPIPDVAHLRKAIRAVGRADPSKRPALARLIARRARALDALSVVKGTWVQRELSGGNAKAA